MKTEIKINKGDVVKVKICKECGEDIKTVESVNGGEWRSTDGWNYGVANITEVLYRATPEENIKTQETEEMDNFTRCLNWLKTVDVEAAKYYEENADKEVVNEGDLDMSINFAFMWTYTPQRMIYWHNLDTKWVNHLKEQDTPKEESKPKGCPTSRIELEESDAVNFPQSFKTLLDAFWSDYRDFLLEKDSKYGSLYLKPLNTLIELSPRERILSRLEEKIGRMLNGNLDDNTLDDILGLLIHLKVVERNKITPAKKH